MRLLVIEDDPLISSALERSLSASGFAVDTFSSLASARDAARQGGFDLVLLDLGLPDGQGMELLAELRQRGDLTPVLIITARDGVDDRVRGLDLGADDYLAKPFSLVEMEARVRALLRRSQGRSDNSIRFGPLTMSSAGSGTLTLQDAVLDLPPRERRLLESLMLHAGKVVSREVIEGKVFGYGEVGSNALEVYISRLRKRLAGSDVQIRTLRGLGYRLEMTGAG
ncbi:MULTISPECIES: response regulator [Cobetia]|uniref:Response regulator transcription factor n=1 Tax=Cobetia crustatorum TaxID=553385 RepID=A0A558HUH0_9GAMM|nr:MULTISPECIES: response regulator transcription factor [Cobetia]TVU72773.1 response regulator transcription factor [Cobetia crustatorum]